MASSAPTELELRQQQLNMLNGLTREEALRYKAFVTAKFSPAVIEEVGGACEGLACSHVPSHRSISTTSTDHGACVCRHLMTCMVPNVALAAGVGRRVASSAGA